MANSSNHSNPIDPNSPWPLLVSEKKGGNNGETALCSASRNGHLAVVNALIQAGADVEARSSLGCSSLILSAVGRSPQCQEVALALIAHGADVRVADNDRQTALHSACIAGNSNVCLSLLAKGARLDGRNIYGKTPCDLWVERGHGDASFLTKASLWDRRRLFILKLWRHKFLATQQEKIDHEGRKPPCISPMHRDQINKESTIKNKLVLLAFGLEEVHRLITSYI